MVYVLVLPKNQLDNPGPAVHGCQVERCLFILVLVVDVGAGIEEQSHAIHVAHPGGHVDRQVVVLIVDAQELFTLGALQDGLDYFRLVLLGGVKECRLVILMFERR